MDGVFMRKFVKHIGVIVLLIGFAMFGGLLADKHKLHDDIIRLHIVANSDSSADQAQKLMVRDALTEYLQQEMQNISGVHQAKEYLQAQLGQLQIIAEQTLREAGSVDDVRVSMCQEPFDTREYDTFSLPAGVYESLRIEIGNGNGKNWWCVVFPSLCIPATTEGFHEVAVSSGFQDTLVDTLTDDAYEIRFFFLDCLGKLENFFFSE